MQYARLRRLMTSRDSRNESSPAGKDINLPTDLYTILTFDNNILRKARLEIFTEGKSEREEVVFRVNAKDLEDEL